MPLVYVQVFTCVYLCVRRFSTGYVRREYNTERVLLRNNERAPSFIEQSANGVQNTQTTSLLMPGFTLHEILIKSRFYSLSPSTPWPAEDRQCHCPPFAHLALAHGALSPTPARPGGANSPSSARSLAFITHFVPVTPHSPRGCMIWGRGINMREKAAKSVAKRATK